MRAQSLFLILGFILIIIGISLLVMAFIKQGVTQSIYSINYSSPSYLLLSNWNNLSIYISTGYPIPKPQLNGEHSLPPSIITLYYGNYGLLNMNITLYGTGPTKSAYLTLNNTVVIQETSGETTIVLPPNSTSLAIIQVSNKPVSIRAFVGGHVNYEIENDTVILNTTPIIKLTSTVRPSVTWVDGFTVVEVELTNGSLIVTLGNEKPPSINELMMEDYVGVKTVLSEARKPGLGGLLLQEYYLSLLLLLDNQNPVTGEFVASPEPVYFYSWVRDSSFSAMALQDAGLYKYAMKYWLWMCSAQNSTGTWYTRYNFWDGKPDTTFGIPEYDSIGLFQMGVWGFYEDTGNRSFLASVLPCIEKSIAWEATEIPKNGGLIPKDLSIWEDNYAYNFWTQAVDDLGLYDTARIYEALGMNNTGVLNLANELHGAIMHYFYSRGFISQALTTTTLFTPNGSVTELVPNGIPDSSVILPIALGLINPRSSVAESTVNFIISKLMVKGGLARFPGDYYHYTEYLYDSSGPDPPWIITTLFLALYYEDIGNYTGAYELMTWCVEHSQHGLLPEALDPNTLEPLPTTSPLTWSAAMYVIAALNYRGPQNPGFSGFILLLVSLALVSLAVLLLVVYGRQGVKRASGFPRYS